MLEIFHYLNPSHPSPAGTREAKTANPQDACSA
jgi:hypothetical protein